MRVEDKELEGPELEREQRLEVIEEVTEEEEEELPVLASEEVVDLELVHRGRLFDALALILADEQVTVSLLGLPKREAQALEFLQTAVTGRDVHMGEFVYAEDRKPMLEQALAVLQQNMTHGSTEQIAELHAKFDALAGRLGDIRGRLEELEEAQDDHEYDRERETKAVKPGDTADKPDESLTGFIASALSALATVAGTDESTVASSLVGPELPETPKPATTLVGTEVPVAPKPASTLDGPSVEREQRSSSLAEGPPIRETLKTPSTLDGPERAPASKRSTLGTDGLSAALLKPRSGTPTEPPERKSSPTIPPVRKSSPSIQVPTKIDPPKKDKP